MWWATLSNLIPPTFRWIIVGAIVAFLAYSWIRNDAFREARKETIEQNEKAKETANQAANTVAACFEAGGYYDFERNTCKQE